LDGIDTEVDYAEALRFLSAAAEKGAPRAMAGLGRMYAEGLGVPRNPAEAVRLYEASANRGEFLAQIELARIFSRGLGVAVDSQLALKWYSAAAAQEDRVGDGKDIQEATAYVAGHR